MKLQQSILKEKKHKPLIPYRNEIKILAADFNGRTFDSSPFSKSPRWLKFNVLYKKNIMISKLSFQHDWAVWDVKTKNGIELAEPNDIIGINTNGLYTRKYKGKQ